MSNNISEGLEGNEINDKNNNSIEKSKNQNPSLLSVKRSREMNERLDE